MDVVVSNCMLLGYTCRAIRGRSAGNGQLWLGSDRSATPDRPRASVLHITYARAQDRMVRLQGR